ncbi:MAG: AAA family ATPase [Haloglomus sp.]
MSESPSTADASLDAETSVESAGETARAVIDNVERVIVGNHDAIEHLISAFLGRGHVLLEDVPGVGKTMLARAVAQSFESEFKRVQFTPDLLPTDITGVNIYNQQTGEFEFQPGPIFANVVLGDEINRAPPKTQSALLEAMEEEQVTVDGESYPVPQPFTVVATQNSVERDRTYDLPAAELDRFMMQLSLGYPDAADEAALLGKVVGDHPIERLEPVATTEDLLAARRATAAVAVEKPLREYVTRLARYTREHAQLGVSPRGAISLLRAGQARAVLDGRDYVVPDDVQAEAQVVMAHRIRRGTGEGTGADLVGEALDVVSVE